VPSGGNIKKSSTGNIKILPRKYKKNPPLEV
jgi:hypothetical protein